MLTPNQPALDFLLTRRSRPAKTLRPPVPTRDELLPILTAAARAPDHGKLEPWRFIVLQKRALTRLADLAQQRGQALGIDADKLAKGVAQYGDANLAVAVVASPKPSAKIPAIEQCHSAAAVCLSLLNAALASGWGANWLTGWASYDRDFMAGGLGLQAHESIAGLIFIGTQSSPPPDRPRPDLDRITTWLEA